MPIRVVRLGTPRSRGEGLRLGTVRHPPRGVPKAQLAARDFYDVWFPTLAPSAEAVKAGRATGETPAAWKAFARRYRKEMQAPEARHALALLASLSRTTDLAVGCYCADEARCHRSILRTLLAEAGAEVAP